MLAAIAQAHNVVKNNAEDFANKHPSEWEFDFDVEFNWGQDEQEEKPRHHHKKHKKDKKKDEKEEKRRW